MTGHVLPPAVELTRRLQEATGRAFGAEHAEVDPLLRRSDRADFQANLAMSLGKSLKRPPRAVAEAIVVELEREGAIAAVEVAGPGFINLTLDDAYLSALLQQALRDPRLGVSLSPRPDTIVIDYPSPNVAKEMHVGHLRPSIIGDAIARTLRFLGHRVIPQNHIGDWGTPFGMLIEHLLDLGGGENAAELSVGELNEFYKAARLKFDGDESFATRARLRVVALQAGDPATLALWNVLVRASVRHFEQIFARLGIELGEADIRGESFYNPYLQEIAEDLARRGLARENDGALCLYPEGFKNREGEPLPLIVRKSDGGFGYAATDLAAFRYRVRVLGGTRLIYVVGGPQQQHLQMVFAASKLAGYAGAARAEHVWFGSILGPDRKMFATRSGETVRLRDLLEEGEDRALTAIEARAAALAGEHVDALAADERRKLARQISLAAIKYADLSNDRVKDYIFDWERMLADEGNTGPYLQYAHARACSILRKIEPGEVIDPAAIRVEHASERTLALALLGLEAAVQAVATTLEPHKLGGYLYDLAGAFATFHHSCSVLRAETPELRASRLALTLLSTRVLRQGLALLGIEAPERM